MATSSYPGTGGFTTTTQLDKFIPELWSDEVIAAFKKKLVMGNLVRKLSFVGKKGDTMHIPMPVRGSVYSKTAGTAVTIQGNTEIEV